MRKTNFVLTIALFSATVAGAALLGAAQNTLINGAGATFPAPIYTKWFDAYHKLFPAVQINYQPVGSGGGIKGVTDATVDFGASDGPMTDEQLKEYQTKHGAPILQEFSSEKSRSGMIRS